MYTITWVDQDGGLTPDEEQKLHNFQKKVPMKKALSLILAEHNNMVCLNSYGLHYCIPVLLILSCMLCMKGW